MDPLKKFYLDWLEKTASHPTSLPTTKEYLIPALMMFSVLAALLLYSLFKTRIRYLAFFNLILVIALLSAFQACADKTTTVTSGQALQGPITRSLPPESDDLGDYFNDGQDSGTNRIRVLTQTRRGRTVSTGSVRRTDPATRIRPDCVQYNALFGVSDYTTAPQAPGRTNCLFLDQWIFTPSDDQPTPVDAAVPDIKTALQTFKANPSATDKKILVMDLKVDIRNTKDIGQLNFETGKPFVVLVYAIDITTENAPKIYILDPSQLTYVVESSTGNTFSMVETLEDGWFKPSFLGYEDGQVSARTSTIRLARYQGPIAPDQPVPPNGQNPNPHVNEVDLGDDGSERTPPVAFEQRTWNLPQVKVLVRPESYTPKMPEFNMPTVLTDNNQELIRGGSRDPGGFVNPATGELSFSHVDLTYPLPQTAFRFDVVRTYRSHFASIGAFGRNQDASFLMEKNYYQLADPIADYGTFEFLGSGDGRKFFLPPQNNSVGPFWLQDDPNKPNVVASKLFQTFNAENLSNMRANIKFDLNGRLVSKLDRSSQNSVFHFYDGSLRMLADQLAVSKTTAEEMKSIIGNFKLAQRFFSEGNIEQARLSAAANLSKPGNYLYFFYNAAGYITGIIDKSGNLNVYTYSNDNLTQVQRIVSQLIRNVDGTSTQGTAQLPYLYKYQYQGLSGRDATWSGLLTKADTFNREEALSSIHYSADAHLYGEAPPVTSYRAGPMEFNFLYNFATENLDINGTETIPSHQSRVTDSLDRVFFYSFNDKGYVSKVEGPTESQRRATLMQSFYDPKLLRTVNTIARGVEGFTQYNRTTGEIIREVVCADREEDSQTQIPATLATLDAQGNYTLECGGLSKSVEYGAGRFYQYDYFFDFGASLIPLEKHLPASARLNIPERIWDLNPDGCLGGVGRVSFRNLMSTNGSYCQVLPDARGVTWQIVKSISQFEDGSLRASNSGAYNFPYGAIPSQTLLTPPGNLPYARTNQMAFAVELPANGFDRVYNGSSYSNLNNSAKILFDLYGNPIYSKHPWGATQTTYYDYRSPVAVKTFSLSADINLFSGNENIVDATRVYDRFLHGYSADGDDFPEMKEELRNNFGGTGELTKHASFDVLLQANAIRPRISFEGDGSKISHQFEPSRPWLKMGETTTLRRSGLVGDMLSVTKTYTYDNYERIESSWDADRVRTSYTFRDIDGGVDETTIDYTSAGGGRSVAKVLTFDWAGRVLTRKLTRSISESARSFAPDLEEQTIEYGPFGEVVKVVKTDTKQPYGSNPAQSVTTTSERTYDFQTGTILSEKTTLSGTNVDTEPKEKIYSDFRPLFSGTIESRTSTNERNQRVSVAGVSGKNLTVTQSAPTLYDGSDLQTISTEQTTYDGCGNILSQSQGSSTTTNQIAYADGLCKVVSSTDPTGWVTKVGYLTNGEVVLTDYTGAENAFALGNDKVASFNVSYVKLCGATAELGNCTYPGYVYSAKLDGGQGRDDKTGTFRDIILRGGQAIFASSNGVPLTDRKFAGRKFETNSTSLNIQTVETDLASEGRSKTESTPFSVYTERKIGSEVKGTNFSLVDWSFKTPIFNEKKSAEGNVLRGSAEVSEFDILGRPKTANHYVGSAGSPSSPGSVAIRPENLVSSMAVEMENGKTKKVTVNHQLGADTHQEVTENVEFFGGTELPARTVQKRIFSAGTVQAEINKIYDGLGRAKQVVVDQTSATNSANPFHDIQVRAEHNYTFDQRGRIQSENVRMEDSFARNEEVQFKNTALNRRLLNSQNNSVTVNYRFRDISGHSIMTMSYSNRFTVDYILSPHDGSITEIDVKTPNGVTHKYFTFMTDDETRSPYAGNTDSGAGRLETYDHTVINWFNDLIGRPLQGEAVLSNFEMPYFTVGQNPITNGSRDLMFRNFKMNILGDRLGKIGMDGLFEGHSAGIAPRINSSLTEVNFSRNTRGNGLFEPQTCDNTMPTSIQGAMQVAPWPLLSSRFQTNNPSLLHVNRFDAFGKLAYARRDFANRASANNATPGNQRWIVEVSQVNDLSGVIASDEFTTYINTNSRNGEAPDYFGDFSNPKYLRAILSRRFMVTNPLPGVIGGGQFIVAKEIVRDPGSSASLAHNAEDRAQSPDSSNQGEYQPIYGPQGIVMNFVNYGDGYWRRIDNIYDAQGNVIMPQEVAVVDGRRVPPNGRAIYGPYLSYVEAKYSGVEAREERIGSDGDIFYHTANSDGDDIYHLSTDPMFVGNHFRQAGGGYYQNMLGFLDVQGRTYDPATGSYLEPMSDADRNKVCIGGLADRAIKMMDSARRMHVASKARAFSPSLDYRVTFDQAMESYVKSFPSFLPGVDAINRGLLSIHFVKSHGAASWYFDSDIANGALEVSGAFEDFIGMGGIMDAAYAGKPMATALSGGAAIVGIGLAGFGGSVFSAMDLGFMAAQELDSGAQMEIMTAFAP